MEEHLMGDARFAGRVAFVTGAGSGVGRATAQLLAAEGAKVYAGDVNEAGVAETVTTIRKAGGTADGGLCDVGSMASVEASVGRAVGAFGGIDVLVNVAGVGRFARFEEITEEQWTQTLSVNMGGAFRTTKAALPHLLKRPGCIVNVGSTASLRGQAYTADYGASKAGLLMFTKCIAMEFATRGLRANCVCPGGVKTPFGRFFQLRDDFEPQLLEYTRPPLRTNFAEPEDIARVIAFAASDDARMITGAALVADGGTTA
jgi:3-oxoacyl-[acyl-carrier protein] reductase